jgi:hypothetical protein
MDLPRPVIRLLYPHVQTGPIREMFSKNLARGFKTDQGDRSVYHHPNLSVYMVRITLCKHAASSFQFLQPAIEQYHKPTADKVYNWVGGNRNMELQQLTLQRRSNQTERIKSFERNIKCLECANKQTARRKKTKSKATYQPKLNQPCVRKSRLVWENTAYWRWKFVTGFGILA